ncbi:MAG: hypothetical protein ACYDER_28145 [Ktedonobacteraceae bacterium]
MATTRVATTMMTMVWHKAPPGRIIVVATLVVAIVGRQVQFPEIYRHEKRKGKESAMSQKSSKRLRAREMGIILGTMSPFCVTYVY